MSASSVSDRQKAVADGPVFPVIACGVDGTRVGFEAARQAALLARDGGTLRLLAVTWETGTHAAAMLELGRHRAAVALDRAAAIAHDVGTPAERVLIDGPDAAAKLLDATRDDDLLVVGSSGRSHAGGLVLGHAADAMLRHAPRSVLVARRPPAATFPDSILVATAHAGALGDAAETAARLAVRHGGIVTLASLEGTDAVAHHAVGAAAARLVSITGVEPVVVDGHGRAHLAAAHLAQDLGAALIVTAGPHAIRIAECARCSVLVQRSAS